MEGGAQSTGAVDPLATPRQITDALKIIVAITERVERRQTNWTLELRGDLT
jgi:hypothetical protein